MKNALIIIAGYGKQDILQKISCAVFGDVIVFIKKRCEQVGRTHDESTVSRALELSYGPKIGTSGRDMGLNRRNVPHSPFGKPICVALGLTVCNATTGRHHGGRDCGNLGKHGRKT